ncbi:glycosyltransferase [Polaribacter uvawellassae]|uniref:glycosyltransferase n=1 Tax=Polaribacter uvawellassae TaxID=3133495 RepID=UPI0032193776
MNVLVLVESLRINETSSGIVSSTFLKALSHNKDINITCIYDKAFNYDITWLDASSFIKLNKTTFKEKSYVRKIPKLNGLITAINGVNSIVKNEINNWVKAIDIQLKENDFDLIITLGSGSEFYPHYAMLNMRTSIKWLANFHDPYPMSVYPEPYKKKRNIFLKWQEHYANRIIKKADFVSFPSLYLKKLMQEKYHFENSKSIILPHIGITLDNLPTSKKDNEVQLPENKFNLLHAGTLLGPRKVESLFNAFQTFLSSSKEKEELSILNVLGKVAKEHKNINEIVTKFPNNFNIITKRVGYKKSLELIEKASISLIIEADAEFSPFMPGKLADLIYLEKPILALTPKKSETIRILGSNHPYQARINDENEILRVLNLLWNDWRANKLNDLDYKSQKEYISAEKLNENINKIIKCTS